MSAFDRDQLQPDETLDDTGVADPLDEGYSPPERLVGSIAKGVTEYEQEVGETLDERIAQEEPDFGAALAHESDLGGIGDGDEIDFALEDDPSAPDQVGNRRAGRLVDPDQGGFTDMEKDMVADDVGIDGAGASAEEAAMHIIDESELVEGAEGDY